MVNIRTYLVILCIWQHPNSLFRPKPQAVFDQGVGGVAAPWGEQRSIKASSRLISYGIATYPHQGTSLVQMGALVLQAGHSGIVRAWEGRRVEGIGDRGRL